VTNEVIALSVRREVISTKYLTHTITVHKKLVIHIAQKSLMLTLYDKVYNLFILCLHNNIHKHGATEPIVSYDW